MTEFKEVTLWKHQQIGFERALPLMEFGFIFDCGTGKSLTTITTLRYKFAHHKKILKTFIVAPLITLENWKVEWLMYSRVEEKYIIILDGPIEKRIKKLLNAFETIGQNLIVITNYQAVVQNKGAKKDPLNPRRLIKPAKQANADKLFNLIMQWNPDVLVSDESHRCADGQSKQAKSVIKISKVTKYRYILTGTFMPNSELDVFSQFLVLDNGASFGTNFIAFRNMYFYDATPHSIAPTWALHEHMKEQFKQKIAAKTMTAKKEDCLDLPKLIEKIQKVEFTKEQRRLYEEMRKEMITFIEDDAVVADIAIVKMLRLAQICSGFVKTDEGKIIRIKSNKVKVLEEILKDLKGQKIIIWSVFHESYKIIGEVLDKINIQYREGHGLVKDKLQQIEDFRSDPNISVLIGNPAAIGEGINIKEAGVRIYYDRDFSFVKREQSSTRNYRGGSVDFHDSVLSIDLVIPNTVDATTLEVVKRKLNKNNDILSLIKETI